MRSALRAGLFCFTLICVMAQAGGGKAWAAEVFFQPVQGNPGQDIDVPVMVDEAVRLAGIKLIVNYDKDLLVFREGNKTKNTGSLMHIVNDKKPGRLVVVMAGARGISGKNIPLLTLKFGIRKNAPKPSRTRLDIAEIQLMSDDLKDIKAGVRAGAIAIGNGPSR